MKAPILRGAASIRRRQVFLTLAAIFGFIGLVMLGLRLSDPRHRAAPPTARERSAHDVVNDYRTPGHAVDPSEIWISRSEARLDQLQKTNEELQRRLDQVAADLERDLPRGRTGPGYSLPPPPGDSMRTASVLPAPPVGPAFPMSALPPPPDAARAVVPATPYVPGRSTLAAPGIVEVSLRDTGKRSAPAPTPKESGPTVRDSLPAGSFGSVVLLNGLDAPTGGLARTNPIPVLMRLLDDGTLPNGFASRVRSCFVTGAGYGDLSSERAYVRLEVLSCVMRDGRIVSQNVEGYLSGEDGKNGLRGKVISKQGQMIGRALFAGIAGGLGQSIAQSYSQVSVSPLGSVQSVEPGDVAKVGLATGVGRALEKIADFYIARANELYPVIEINSARRGEIVLTNTVALGATFGAAWSDDD